MSNKMRFKNELLVKLMNDLGANAEDLSFRLASEKKVKLSSMSIRNWLSGRATPTLQSVLALAEFFEVKAGVFFDCKVKFGAIPNKKTKRTE